MGIGSIAAPGALALGMTMGGMAAAASLQPTVSPRSGLQQGILTGVSAAGGLAVGAGLAKLASTLTGRMPGGALAVFGAMALGGFAAAKFGDSSGTGAQSKLQGAVGSTGTIMAAAGVGGLGLMGASKLGKFGPVAVALGLGAMAWKFHGQSTETSDKPSRVETNAERAAAVASRRPVDASAPEALATVSGGANSLFTMDEIGREGQRFVTDAVPGSTIQRVMGTGIDPVRVYAGLNTGTTAQERVDAAMQECERLGVFDGSRKQVIVATCTGSGFIDPPSIQTAEFMGRGRTATIALQYAAAPSIMSTGKVPLGAETTELMLEAVQKRIAKMPADQRPEVVMFGESLGAWAQQDVFEGSGMQGLRKLGVDRALWVGSPHESGFASQVADWSGPVGTFDRIEEVDALSPAERAKLRYVLLTHDNDAVSVLNKGTAMFQRPEWLPADGPKPNGVPQSMRFVPGVTFAQGLVDLFNGTKPEPGKFEAHSHDYRADLPEFVRQAYGYNRIMSDTFVSDRQVQSITTELIQMEKDRAAMMAAGAG